MTRSLSAYILSIPKLLPKLDIPIEDGSINKHSSYAGERSEGSLENEEEHKRQLGSRFSNGIIEAQEDETGHDGDEDVSDNVLQLSLPIAHVIQTAAPKYTS